MLSFKTAALLAAVLLTAGCSGFFGESEEPPLPGKREPILETSRTVKPHLSLSNTQVTIPPENKRQNWPQANGSAAHSGGHPALGQSLTQLWSTSTATGAVDEARRPLTPPIVANGRVFLMDAVLNVRAYDAETGREIWAIGSASQGEHDGFGGGVASDGPRVYAVGGHGEALALEAETGRLFWRASLPGPARGAPTVRDGKLFVVTADNRLLALNTDDGRLAWDLPSSGASAGILGGSSAAANDDAVVAAMATGELLAVRTSNGRELWRNSLAALRRFDFGAKLSDIEGQPVLDGDRVYAVSAAGRAAAFSMRTGNRIWERPLGSTQTPWLAGDWMFLVTTEAELVAIDRNTGFARWVHQMPRFDDPEDKEGEFHYAGPVLAGGTLHLIRSDGTLFRHSPVDGKALAQVDTGDETYLPPVIANGTLFLFADDGTLSAFR